VIHLTGKTTTSEDKKTVQASAEVRLRGRLFRFIEEPRHQSAVVRGLSKFFDGKTKPDQDHFMRFHTWHMMGHRFGNGDLRGIDWFEKEWGERLPDDEKDVLNRWLQSRPVVLEITKVMVNGLNCRDLIGSDELSLDGYFLGTGVNEGDLLIGWGVPTETGWTMEGIPYHFPARMRKQILDDITGKTGKKLDATGFIRSYPSLDMIFRSRAASIKDPSVVTFEGDAVEVCRAHYDLSDRETVTNILNDQPDFWRVEGEDEGDLFDWVRTQREVKEWEPPGDEGARRPMRISSSIYNEEGKDTGFLNMGSVQVLDNELILQCLSHARLKMGRELIEEVLNEMVSFSKEGKGSEEENRVEKEQNLSGEDVLDNLIYEHYKRWLDSPLEVLDGMTPRETSRTQGGRTRLKELIKQIQANSKKRGGGLKKHHVDFLKNELGL